MISFKKNIFKVVFGITFALSIALNFKLVLNLTKNVGSPSVNSNGTFKDNVFTYDGRKYGNVTINNYTINSNGELKVGLSAIDQATGDSVKFASQASVEPAKFGTAIWGKSKYQ